jgi:hypothetical protein
MQEFSSFISVNPHTQLIVDRSSSNELLKINFNISLPALSCEFATLDVSDALGTVRAIITHTHTHTCREPRSPEPTMLPRPPPSRSAST